MSDMKMNNAGRVVTHLVNIQVKLKKRKLEYGKVEKTVSFAPGNILIVLANR